MRKYEFRHKRTCKTPSLALTAIFSSLALLAGLFLLPTILWGAAAEGKGEGEAEKLPNFAENRVLSGGTGENTARQIELREGEPIRVLLADGQVAELPLEEYVWGVVAAEMPASFATEALRAQAVAARTYAARCAQSGKHPGADVCADSACCQAYRSRADMMERWGENGPEYAGKLSDAVTDTAGEVLRYQGALISAAFHSSSDGATAEALQVWGSDAPYLTSVSTPETEDEVPNFKSREVFAPSAFAALWQEKYPQADLTGEPESWFSGLERSDWGGVSRLTVGGVTVTGGEARAALGLRSTRFTVAVEGGEIAFTATGYGHGVGMSQYGANILANQGQTYQQILTHYYTGVTIEPL